MQIGQDENRFIELLQDYIKRADEQNRVLFMDFYNVQWMEALIAHYIKMPSYIRYYSFGGYEGAERRKLAISPFEITDEWFDISALEIEVKVGIGKKLSHRDYLGAILGIGIKREKIGDIILSDAKAYILLDTTFVSYVMSQLQAIGKYKSIVIKPVSLVDLPAPETNIKTIKMVVSSMRVDAIVAAMFGLSRADSVKLIKGDRVKKNGLQTKVSESVKEADTISVRGFGKAKLAQINQKTQKGKVNITIEKNI